MAFARKLTSTKVPHAALPLRARTVPSFSTLSVVDVDAGPSAQAAPAFLTCIHVAALLISLAPMEGFRSLYQDVAAGADLECTPVFNQLTR